MKIIDLLNKIAKGEEVPERIVYSDKIWYWVTRENDYVEDYKRLFNYYLNECLISSLNDEIKIIEDKKIEKMTASSTNGFEQALVDKINEIIDYINKGE